MVLNQKKTWADIVKGNLGEPAEGITIQPHEGGDDFDYFDSDDKYNKGNCYHGEKTCQEEDFSGNQISGYKEEVSFTVKESDQETLEKQSHSKEILTSTQSFPSENVVGENIPVASDTQTLGSIQVESSTGVSDNQNSADAENNTTTRHGSSRTRSYSSGGYPTHRQNNRHENWNEHSHNLRPQGTPIVGYQNPQFGHGNMQERHFHGYQNSQNPGPMPYVRPPPPPPCIRHISDLQQHVKFLEDKLWKNTQSLSQQIERKLRVEEKYNDCLTQLHLYEEALKDSKENPNLSKPTELQTNGTKCTCQAKFQKKELANIEDQEYLLKLLNDMFDINHQLKEELNQKKIDSEQRQDKKQMVSVQVQTDLQQSSSLKTIHGQAVLTQTEMDKQETRCEFIPVYQTISTETKTELLVKAEEINVSETPQKEDQQGEKKPSKKSKCKNKKKALVETIPESETLNDQNVSGENTEQQEVSTSKIIEDQSIYLQNEVYANDTVMSKPPQVCEAEKVSETPQTVDKQVEKKPSKKSKRKNRKKALVETIPESETLKDQKVSGENTEQQEVSTSKIIEDQPVSLQNEVDTNDTVMSKLPQVCEGEKIDETPQNGDQQEEKKPSKKSKRKNRKMAKLMKTTPESETLNDENVSGENTEQIEVSAQELVIHTNEMGIFKMQQVSKAEKVPELFKNEDQQQGKKPPEKSKDKKRNKTTLETTSHPETLNDQKVYEENIELHDVSNTEMVQDQTVSLQNEIHANETVISKPQRVSEEGNITAKNQTLVQRAETTTLKAVLETKEAEIIKAPEETVKSESGQKEEEVLKVMKIRKIERDAKSQEKSIKKEKKIKSKRSRGRKTKTEMDPQTINNLAVSGEVIVDESKTVSGLEAVTSPSQIKLKKDVIQKPPQGFEKQRGKELPVQDKSSDEKKSSAKNVSLWRRLKKCMTPAHRRQYKDRKENISQ